MDGTAGPKGTSDLAKGGTAGPKSTSDLAKDGSTEPKSTSDLSKATVGRPGAISITLRTLGFTDTRYPNMTNKDITDFLAKEGVTNIFGPDGKLNTSKKVKLNDKELRLLENLAAVLYQDSHSLSTEQKASFMKIKQTIIRHDSIVGRKERIERMDAAKTLLSLGA
jgi:hypothetical protein